MGLRRLSLASSSRLLFGAGNANAFCRTTTEVPDYDAVVNGCFATVAALLAQRVRRLQHRARRLEEDLLRRGGNNLSRRSAVDRRELPTQTGDSSARASASTSATRPRGLRQRRIPNRRREPERHPLPRRELEVRQDRPRPSPPSSTRPAPARSTTRTWDQHVSTWDLAVPRSRQPEQYDFLSVITHEAGHFLSMAHSDVQNATSVRPALRSGPDSMPQPRARRRGGDLQRSTVRTASAVLNSKVTAAPQCDPPPRPEATARSVRRRDTGCRATRRVPGHLNRLARGGHTCPGLGGGGARDNAARTGERVRVLPHAHRAWPPTTTRSRTAAASRGYRSSGETPRRIFDRRRRLEEDLVRGLEQQLPRIHALDRRLVPPTNRVARDRASTCATLRARRVHQDRVPQQRPQSERHPLSRRQLGAPAGGAGAHDRELLTFERRDLRCRHGGSTYGWTTRGARSRRRKEYDFLKASRRTRPGTSLRDGPPDVKSSTMYASYKAGQTVQRVLTDDDIEGICSIYRPDGKRSVLNDSVAAAPAMRSDPEGRLHPRVLFPPARLRHRSWSVRDTNDGARAR